MDYNTKTKIEAGLHALIMGGLIWLLSYALFTMLGTAEPCKCGTTHTQTQKQLNTVKRVVLFDNQRITDINKELYGVFYESPSLCEECHIIK